MPSWGAVVVLGAHEPGACRRANAVSVPRRQRSSTTRRFDRLIAGCPNERLRARWGGQSLPYRQSGTGIIAGVSSVLEWCVDAPADNRLLTWS